MNISSVFYSAVSFFQGYSLIVIISTILGLMISVFLFRKNENYSFIVLVLTLSLLTLFYIPSFILADSLFYYLSEKAGILTSFIVFILLNLVAILFYVFYKKIFSTKILLKYLALPVILTITAVGFSVISGLLVGLIFFNSDNTGNFLGPWGGVFFTAMASVGFNLLLAAPIYKIFYKKDISEVKLMQNSSVNPSFKLSFKQMIKSPVFIIILLIILGLVGIQIFLVAKEVYYSRVTVVSGQNSWPEYKSNGYSFKYPPKGEVMNRGGGEDYGYEEEVWIQTNTKEEGARDSYSITLTKYRVEGNEKTLNEWWENEKDYLFEMGRDLTTTKTTPDYINGYEALWVEVEGDDIVFLKKADTIIMLDAMVLNDIRYDSKKETHDMLVNIVNTLKID